MSPFGDLRDDLRAGIISSTVANSQGNQTKPSDFMPYYEQPTLEPITDQEAWDSWIANCKVS